jgi:hypothetical protein
MIIVGSWEEVILAIGGGGGGMDGRREYGRGEGSSK